MFFRGAQIQRDGQGGCHVLLPAPLSNVRAGLSSSSGLVPFIDRTHHPIEQTSSTFTNTSVSASVLEASMPAVRGAGYSLPPLALVEYLTAPRFRATWSVGELPLAVASGSSTVRTPRPRRNATRHHVGRSGVTQKDSRCTATSW